MVVLALSSLGPETTTDQTSMMLPARRLATSPATSDQWSSRKPSEGGGHLVVPHPPPPIHPDRVVVSVAGLAFKVDRLAEGLVEPNMGEGVLAVLLVAPQRCVNPNSRAGRGTTTGRGEAPLAGDGAVGPGENAAMVAQGEGPGRTGLPSEWTRFDH